MSVVVLFFVMFSPSSKYFTWCCVVSLRSLPFSDFSREQSLLRYYFFGQIKTDLSALPISLIGERIEVSSREKGKGGEESGIKKEKDEGIRICCRTCLEAWYREGWREISY